MRGSSPRMTEWRPGLEKTLVSRRHKALIALLIERREATGMTQTQLADRLGQYQSFVARLESGQRRGDVVEVLELAEALGVDAGKGVGGGEKNGIAQHNFARAPIARLVINSTSFIKNGLCFALCRTD